MEFEVYKERLVQASQNRLANRWVILAFFMWFAMACSGNGYTRWVANTLSTPPSPVFDPTDLTQDPIAIVPVQTPDRLRGYGPGLSQALQYALKHSTPTIQVISSQETINRLNRSGLREAFNHLVKDWNFSGYQDPKRLQSIGSALGVKFLLIPGVVDLERSQRERLDALGLKTIVSEISALRLSMQIWNTATGEILWESFGEGYVKREGLIETRFAVGFFARNLWLSMIQDLQEGKTSSYHEGFGPDFSQNSFQDP